MNNKRRDSLRESLRYLGRVIQIAENICDQETDSMDNCPENLQSSDRFIAMEDAVDNLGEAIGKLEEAQGYIESAISG